MLDDIKINLKSHFCRKNVVMDIITFRKNLKNTSGLSILLHGVISLPDVTSYDKINCVLEYECMDCE